MKTVYVEYDYIVEQFSEMSHWLEERIGKRFVDLERKQGNSYYDSDAFTRHDGDEKWDCYLKPASDMLVFRFKDDDIALLFKLTFGSSSLSVSND